jgi:hypothetical protein
MQRRTAAAAAAAARHAIIVAALCAALSAGGCIFGSGKPRDRIGALPFPGPFTLYTVANPDKLGKHRYGTFGRIPIIQTDEKERGIIYARKAGFIDVAHIRESIDWTRYDTQQLRKAIKAGHTEMRIAGKNNAQLLIALKYPDGWSDLPAAERRALGEEMAIRGGQQLGYLTTTWHELITWYGHRKIFLIDEQPSAFTYDDTMSHMVGITVAGRALRDKRRGWDGAVTVALREVMKEIGAVTPVQTELAVDSVEGLWWKDGEPLKRQFAPPPGDAVAVTPWLVHDLPFARVEGLPAPFVGPSLRDVNGRDCSGFIASVHIQPNIDEGDRMKRTIDARLPYLSANKDIPALLAAAELEMTERFGAAVNVPWPDVSSPTRLARTKRPSPAANPPPPTREAATEDEITPPSKSDEPPAVAAEGAPETSTDSAPGTVAATQPADGPTVVPPPTAYPPPAAAVVTPSDPAATPPR